MTSVRITGLALCALLAACAPRGTSSPAGAPAARTPAAEGCTLGDADGRRLWHDVPANADDCALQRFAFNNFLYLARDGGDGHPRLMSLAPWYEAIPQDGSAPRWRDGYKPLRARLLRKTALEGQPGDGFELIDAAHRRVAYDVRVNRTFVDYLVASGSYRYDVLTRMQAAFAADPSTGGVWLPSGSATTPGALSVKTAWRRFAPDAPCPAATMHCERDAFGREWGLIGLHLVQKTPTLGEMTWATFEHVANAPDCAPGGAAPIAPSPVDPLRPDRRLPGWNLFDWDNYRAQGGDGTRCAVPDGAYQYTVDPTNQSLQNQTCGTPSATPLCNVDPRRATAGNPQVEGYHRINVCRTTPLAQCTGSGTDADNAACLTASLVRSPPEGLATPWRYYRLIGSEYLAGHAPATGCFRYDDGQTLATAPPRSRFPSTCNGDTATPQRTLAGNTALANTSMETWMQAGTCLVQSAGATPLMGRDCFACHAPATNPPGWPFGMGDMSFVFDRVPVPGQTPLSLMIPDGETQ